MGLEQVRAVCWMEQANVDWPTQEMILAEVARVLVAKPGESSWAFRERAENSAHHWEHACECEGCSEFTAAVHSIVHCTADALDEAGFVEASPTWREVWTFEDFGRSLYAFLLRTHLECADDDRCGWVLKLRYRAEWKALGVGTAVEQVRRIVRTIKLARGEGDFPACMRVPG